MCLVSPMVREIPVPRCDSCPETRMLTVLRVVAGLGLFIGRLRAGISGNIRNILRIKQEFLPDYEPLLPDSPRFCTFRHFLTFRTLIPGM